MLRLLPAVVAMTCVATLQAQTITEYLTPFGPVDRADFDNAMEWPVGPTSVDALRAALSGLADLQLTTSSAAPGSYNTQPFHPGIGNQSGALNVISNIGNQPFDAADVTLFFTDEITEVGFGVGDWIGPMILDFYQGSTLVLNYTTSVQTGNVIYYNMTGGTFDRVEIRPTMPAGNWLIVDELAVQEVST